MKQHAADRANCRGHLPVAAVTVAGFVIGAAGLPAASAPPDATKVASGGGTSAAGAASSAATTAPSTRAAQRPISDFRPSRDGFSFTNAFRGLPVKSSILDRPGQRYGLCGGMSFAAADYFVARQALPRVDAEPQKGSPLWSYLFRRQVDSIDGGKAEQFLKWSRLPDAGRGSVAALTRDEVAAATKLLDAGKPAVLGLVLVDNPLDVFENHQILAYRYETKGDITTFRTYDPNYPGDDARILTAEVVAQKADGEDVAAMRTEIGAQGGRTRAIRGFFVMAYRPADPAAAMGGDK